MGTQSERTHRSLMTAILSFLGCIAVNARAPMPLLAGQNDEPNDLRWDLAKRYQVTWESVELSSSLCNPAQSDGANSGMADRSLTISVRLGILDTNDVVGLYVCPVVWEALDGNGERIPYRLEMLPLRFEPLRWDARTANPRDWPARLTIQLCFAPDLTLPSSVSSLKGYLHLLYAQDVVNADVPFAVGDWIEVLPDLEIRVTDNTPPPPGPLQLEYVSVSDAGERPHKTARYTSPLCVYVYYTVTRSKVGERVIGLGMDWPLVPLFDYALIKTELVESQGKGVADVRFARPGFYGGGGIVATGSWQQDFSNWDVIRHRIAVKPYEVKVPFVLENIPVPTYQPAETQANSEAETSLTYKR
jgi:hypothetical protein